MKLKMERKTGLARLLRGSAMAIALVGSAALAQSFPSKPVTIISAGPPGGGVDTQARIIAEAVAPLFGQPVVVDSKPGASGTLATNLLLNAPSDGHHVMVNMDGLLTEVPHSIKTSYDPFEDLTPLVTLYDAGLFLVARPDFPADTIPQLVDYIRGQPAGSVAFGSYGTGTISHVLGLMLNHAAGVQLSHIPYKGAPLALQDVMGGHLPLASVGPTPLPALVKSGKLKLLGYSGSQRSALFPEVSTFTEAGYPDVVALLRVVLYAPSDMPVAAQQKWREAVATAYAQQKTLERMAAFGNSPAAEIAPEALAKILRADHDKVGELLRAVASAAK